MGRDQLQNIMFIGLDVHKATISVALAQGDRGGEVRHWGTIPNRADHVRKLADKLGGVGFSFISAMRQDRAATACTGSSPISATTAWSSRPRAFQERRATG